MVDLIGFDQPAPGFFAMPLMRGFPCEVHTPEMDGTATGRPPQGLGVGVQTIPGSGARFFLSIGNEDGVLVAMLDHTGFQRLAELLAAAGKQSLLVPGVEPDE